MNTRGHLIGICLYFICKIGQNRKSWPHRLQGELLQPQLSPSAGLQIECTFEAPIWCSISLFSSLMPLKQLSCVVSLLLCPDGAVSHRWSEVTRQLELWVKVMELNEAGEFTAVEVVPAKDVRTGGIFQLRQVVGVRARACICVCVCGIRFEERSRAPVTVVF